MEKRLIFNGDDFGLSKGVNLGIMDTYLDGPLRSATMMAGGLEFDHAVWLAKQHPDLKIGAHLTLTASANLSVGGVYQTITNKQGRFLHYEALLAKAKNGFIDLGEVEAEYEAQIEKIIAAGIQPDHLDSHQHAHILPGIFDVFLKVAKKYGIMKVRSFGEEKEVLASHGLTSTDVFDRSFYGEQATFAHLKDFIRSFSGDSLEIMLHPAFIDMYLLENSKYNLRRAFEHEILTSTELSKFLKYGDYKICSFSDL